jgi:raffinose/stachyose/melibiose transport system substrate-binding protein
VTSITPLRTWSKPILRVGMACLVAGMGTLTGNMRSHAADSVNITIQLQPNTGAPDSPNNKVLVSLTNAYEKAHPGVTVTYQPNSFTDITKSNARLVALASAHSAPDVVWEQYGEVTGGSLPKGLLQNVRPYLERPNPYVAGNKRWLDLWQPVTLPYMRSANGDISILLGSDVDVAMFYDKANFATAGITAAPKTWKDWVGDMAKLKSHGITPYMFADGGICNPSWYEREFSSVLLHNDLSKFNVDHQQVATGLDTAVGITRGIISMNNPAYAEGWKLLGSLQPYLAPGASTFDACSLANAASPPLFPVQPFVQNRFSMIWGGTWYFHDLDTAGYNGKYGIFPFPAITTATTKYSSNIDVRGVIGGPNGSGQWSVTTQQADSSMTPAKTKQVMDFLAYLYTPQSEGKWVAGMSNGTYIPLIKGTPSPKIPGLNTIIPKGLPPTTVEGILDGGLTAKATRDGSRLLQSYLSGDTSWSSFSTQWEAILKQAASDWASQNKVDLSKYK